MANDNGAPKGYVYILTNPSFREDWIKIGKSSRPVNIRSKELDNTAVPLPFEIYATMKTSSYDKIEDMLHSILEGAHTRIRPNREFFNVKPEDALRAFYKIADIIPDAEVYVRGEEPIKEPALVKPEKHSIPKKPQVVMRGNLVEVHPHDDLPKGARYSLDGDKYYSMARFGFVFIKQLLIDDPSLTFQQIETLFPKNMLGGFQYCGVVARKEIVNAMSYSPEAKQKRYRCSDSDALLSSSDGVAFYTSTQWERESFKKLLAIAEEHGYRVFILRK